MTALLTRWREIAICALLFALAITIALYTASGLRKDAALTAEKQAHADTVKGYRLAAEKARADDLAHVKAVSEQQTAITEKVTHEYESRLADSDARYERLRATATAYSRRPAEPGVPETRDATCLAYAAARCDELPARMKAAQDNTDRLVGLQAWVAGQVNVAADQVVAATR